MKSMLGKRAVSSFVSLLVLIVLVFFLSRLTGDPAALYLPIDASEAMRENFREINGLNDPVLVQFRSFARSSARNHK